MDQLRVKGDQYTANFGFADVLFEVSESIEDDPYRDPSAKSERDHVFIPNNPDSPEATDKALGQIASHVAAVCARQYRTHCFTVSIYGPTARIIRWDRAGVMVSRAFDYHKQPRWLKEFARRYSEASDAQRGYDMTATRASEAEEDIFVEIVKKHVKDQLLPKDDEELEKHVEEHYEKDRVFKLSIWPQDPPARARSHATREVPKRAPAHEAHSGEDSATTPRSEASTLVGSESDAAQEPLSVSRKYASVQYFLVSRPVMAPTRTATGKSTRGYWAVKLPDAAAGETEHSICFVKDVWRMNSPGMETKVEGEFMVGMIEDGVRYISDIFCHGDIPSAEHDTAQETETQNCFGEDWNRNKMMSRPYLSEFKHYRIAFVEVGYPLSTLSGTKELIHGTLTAFYGTFLSVCNSID